MPDLGSKQTGLIVAAILLLSSSALAQSPSPHPFLATDYGAVADCQVSATGTILGGTDLGPPLQAALNAWAVAGGRGAVEIPAGNYCMFTPVEKLGGAQLTLDGSGAIVFVSQPSTTPFHFSATQTVIRDLVIAGNMASPSALDCKHLFDFEGNITVTLDGVQVFGVYAYDPIRGGAIVAANVNQLNVVRSAFYGTAANPYGGAIVAPAIRVEDVVFQDYGSLATGSYEKTWNEQIAWVICSLQTQTMQSFGAPRRSSCLIERARFDEGAKWQIWAPSAAETLLPPGTRRQRVEVRNSAFMVPAVTQGRAINVKDTDDVQLSGLHMGIRWDEPAISCYGCGDVRVDGVSWRPLGAADGWPNTPPGLILKILADYTSRSLDARNVANAIIQAAAPTWVTRDGGMHVAGSATCDRVGKFYFNTATSTFDVCDGTAWKKVALQ